MQDYEKGRPDMAVESQSIGDRETTSIEANIREAAGMMREGLVRVIRSSGHNPTRLYIAVCRLAGMSMAEIGTQTRMSKQGVQKHLIRIEAAEPKIKGLFTATRLAIVPSLLPRNAEGRIMGRRRSERKSKPLMGGQGTTRRGR